MHKCDRCEYKGEHQEMGFQAIGVCLMESDLVGAVLSFNATKCPYFKEDLPLPQKLGKLQSIISQLGKALCNKQNASFDEILQAANQLKSRLAQAERERDAAVADLKDSAPCFACHHFQRNMGQCKGGRRCIDEYFRSLVGKTEYDGSEWHWRGVCDENTKEDDHA